jgi:ribosome-associated translation inhibitor RaiA
MNIEFYTPSGQVCEPLVATVRKAITLQHKLHSEISKAEVSFEQRKKIVSIEKICEIRFVISGLVILVTGTADSYDKAVPKAIQKLEEAITLYFKIHPAFAELAAAPAEI